MSFKRQKTKKEKVDHLSTLSFSLSLYLSIFLSNYLSIYLTIYTISLTIFPHYLSLYLTIFLSNYLSLYLTIGRQGGQEPTPNASDTLQSPRAQDHIPPGPHLLRDLLLRGRGTTQTTY
jgi:hypothetical protein